jgi:hypothetical protein
MKKWMLSAWLLLPVWIPATVFCQGQDTIFRTVTRSEPLNLNLLWYSINHGSIYWEKSPDGKQWKVVSGPATKNYHVAADSNACYRAKIVSGTCDPWYSSVTKINVLNIHTDSIALVDSNQAVVYATLGVDSASYPEKGIWFDTKTVPDQNSPQQYCPSGITSFITPLTGLKKGEDYYVRAYCKSTEGVYYPGNILHFSTPCISGVGLVNVSQTQAELFLTVSATPPPSEFGVYYCPGVSCDTNAAIRIKGFQENDSCRVVIQGLQAATGYSAIPYMVNDHRVYTGKTFSFTTFSDYSSFPVDPTVVPVGHKIVWDSPSTARKISPDGMYAEYGRIKRFQDSDTLILVYHGGPNSGDWENIYLRLSYDNGNTWEEQQVLKNINDHISEYWRFCTPEILVLKNGWVMIAYEANAKPDENKSSVQLLVSRDTCRTWGSPLTYVTGRSWEPAMVQLPNGEIELFYSSEAAWWPDDPIYQEIKEIVSTDNGQTWSTPKTVAYYPAKRDGMPVPVLLQGNRGVAFAIETVNSPVSPFIIYRHLAQPWILTTSGFYNNTYRWLVGNFSGHGGGPYLLQLPTGEVALSVHVYKGGDWHQNNYMQVMLGNSSAKTFSQLTTPWGTLPVNESAVNNSLFLKDTETIVAVSSRNFTDGSGGIYWLEGKIVPLP